MRSEARVERLTKQIADLLPSWSLAPVVEAIQAMRGVAFIVAVTVAAEVGDFSRFDNPRQLMAYLGLTPSEHSSGASVRRGGITKAGSRLARHALVEGAWSYRMQARVGRKQLDRIEAVPQVVRDIAWKGQLRMCQRYRHMMAVGQTEGRGNHGDRARDGRVHLGHCARSYPRERLKLDRGGSAHDHPDVQGRRWNAVGNPREAL